MEGNLRFKIDWASLIALSKFTVFALFYFVFEGNFPSTSSRGGLYLEGLIFGILRYFQMQYSCFISNVNVMFSCSAICGLLGNQGLQEGS